MTDKRVEAAKLALARLRAAEAGGCFNPVGDTQGECADGDCYCTRGCENAAQAALSAADAAVADEAKRGRDAMRQWAADMEAAAFATRDAKLAALSIDLLKCAALIERLAGLEGRG